MNDRQKTQAAVAVGLYRHPEEGCRGFVHYQEEHVRGWHVSGLAPAPYYSFGFCSPYLSAVLKWCAERGVIVVNADELPKEGGAS